MTTVIGNFILGNLGDRIGNRFLFVIGFLLWAATLFWLASVKELWMIYVFAAVFGFVHGGMGPSQAPLLARLFGLSSHGLIFGVVDFGFIVGAAVGALVTGHVFDITGSYQTAFIICATLSAIGLILTVILRPIKKISAPVP